MTLRPYDMAVALFQDGQPTTTDNPGYMIFPLDLFTDGNGTGPNRRMRVDVGQTGFFAGRTQYFFHPFTLGNGVTEVIKLVTPIDLILNDLHSEIIGGSVAIEAVVGGTEGGTFGTTQPTFRSNTMSTAPAYTSQVSVTYGGTLTGGTTIDLVRLKSAGATAQESTISQARVGEIGVGAGTYYLRITSSDNATDGVLYLMWEERPAGV